MHKMAMITLEICVETLADAHLAVANGADRIELCAQLSADGLTPSAEMLADIAMIGAPCMVMIRPHSDHFVYGATEVQRMCAAIEAAKASAAAGVVFGALTADWQLDSAVLADLLACADGLPATLHRAFDYVQQPLYALDTAIELGFKRILSAGGMRSAWAGRDTLAAMVAHADGNITILPGGGVRAKHAAALLRHTGATEVHASCRMMDTPADIVRVDAQCVRALRAAIDA